MPADTDQSSSITWKKLRTAWTAAVISGTVSPAAGQVQIEASVLPLELNSSGRALTGGLGDHAGVVEYSSGSGGPTATLPAVWRNGILEGLPVPNGFGGTVFSQADGILGGATFGESQLGSAMIATLWVGPQRARVELNPPGQSHATVRCITEHEQVGYTGTSASISFPSAGIGDWPGYAPTPALPFVSTRALPDKPPRAMLWKGSAESAVNLHPAGAEKSMALGTDGRTQVGIVDGAAAVWHGTAESVQMLPVGDYERTVAVSVNEDLIVGYAVDYSGLDALFWPNPHAEPQVLHPLGDLNFALNSLDGIIVGEATASGISRHAVVWLGADQLPIDLHSFLPEALGYVSSTARSIHYFDGRYLISGDAARSGFGYGADPIVWTFRVPEPAAGGLLAGLITALLRRRHQTIR